VSRAYITQTFDHGDGTVTVTGTDGHDHVAQVTCGRDKLIDGTVYLMLDRAIAKVTRTVAALQRADVTRPGE
jgi:hypothetical protein